MEKEEFSKDRKHNKEKENENSLHYRLKVPINFLLPFLIEMVSFPSNLTLSIS
jgi:hypothetical protein